MAEAIVNTRFKDEWKAYSAGIKPAGYVHPKALQVLEEVSISHQGKSKHINTLQDTDFDLVVIVCDNAAENCPLWLGSGSVIHHSFPDPAQTTSSEEEILALFRRVRDEILEKIPVLLRGT